jgi:hypothetical protein
LTPSIIKDAGVVLRSLGEYDNDMVFELLSHECVIRFMLFPKFDQPQAAGTPPQALSHPFAAELFASST